MATSRRTGRARKDGRAKSWQGARAKAMLERRSAAQRAERELLGGMSRRDLAARARLNHSHVCRALRGERRLSADAIEKVAKAMGLTMDDVQRMFRTIAAGADAA